MNQGDEPKLRAQAAWLEERLTEMSQRQNAPAQGILDDEQRRQVRNAEYAVLLGRIRSQLLPRGIVIDKSTNPTVQKAEAVPKRDPAQNRANLDGSAVEGERKDQQPDIEKDQLDFVHQRPETATSTGPLRAQGISVVSDKEQSVERTDAHVDVAELRSEVGRLRLQVEVLRTDNEQLRSALTNTEAAESTELAGQASKFAQQLKTAQTAIKHLETALYNSDAVVQRQAVQLATLEAENVRLSTAGRELQRRLELVSGSVAGLRAELLEPNMSKVRPRAEQTINMVTTAEIQSEKCATAPEAADTQQSRNSCDLKNQNAAPSQDEVARRDEPAIQPAIESTIKIEEADKAPTHQKNEQKLTLESTLDSDQRNSLEATSQKVQESAQQGVQAGNQQALQKSHAESTQPARIERSGCAPPQTGSWRRVVKKKVLKQ